MRRLFIILLFFCTLACGEEPKAVLLDLQLPITGVSGQTVKNALNAVSQEEAPILLIRMRVPANQQEFGRSSDFGACYSIAELLRDRKFANSKTVCFMEDSVQGHALLVALACRERLLSPKAEIGSAGLDESTVSQAQRQAYREMSSLPKAVVDKMLDAKLDLFKLETERGTRFAARSDIESIKKQETLLAEPIEIFPAGAPAIFGAEKARELGVVDFLASDLREAAGALGIAPENIQSIPVFNMQGRATKIEIRGIITPAKAAAYIRQIETEFKKQNAAGASVNLLVLQIDSAGGSLGGTLQLALFLAEIDRMQCRTVAFVPNRAFSDAAIIALACHEVVLGPNAVLGGDGQTVFNQQEIADASRTIATTFSRAALRNWSLPVAMIDPNLDVFRMTHKTAVNRVAFFSLEELSQQKDAENWNTADRITVPKKLFSVKGDEAVKFRLANRVTDDIRELKQMFHLQDEIIVVDPNWVDKLAERLASPRVSLFLLIIAFSAFWTEIKTPGIGAGAFVSIICFGLFFWSHYLGGTVGTLELTLFIVGVLFILIEILIIPGFSLFGLGGAAAILFSLVLASQTFVLPRNAFQMNQFADSLLTLAISVIGMTAIAFTAAKWLNFAAAPKEMEMIRESEKLADYAHLLGESGTAKTRLIPSGKALIGDKIIDVVSDCEMIESGAPIKVVDVRGYRVVVAKKT